MSRVGLVVILCLAFAVGIAMSANGPGSARAASQRQATEPVLITIGTNSLDPVEAYAPLGAPVRWHNATSSSVSVTVELEEVSSILLPLIAGPASGSAASAGPADQAATVAQAASETPIHPTFTLSIPPGGSFTHTFQEVGAYHYQVSAPSLAGVVMVVPPGTQELTFDDSQGALTLRVAGVSLLDILLLLDERYGLEIVVYDLGDESVTVDLQGVPLDDALATILPRGAGFHYRDRGLEFPTLVSRGEERGEPVHNPFENKDPKRETPVEPPDKLLPEEVDAEDPSGDKPLPENVPDVPGEGEMKDVEIVYEVDHPRFGFRITGSDVEVLTGAITPSELAPSTRLAGPFIYAVLVDGQVSLLGSMRDPLEVSVHGLREHEHRLDTGGEGVFSLALPSWFLEKELLPATTIVFYRLQQPPSPDLVEPLPQELTPQTFEAYAPYLDEVDVVDSEELLGAFGGTRSPSVPENHIAVTTLLRSGGNGAKRNLVVIGDGFQTGQQAAYNTFVNTYVMDGMFQDGALRETANAFNIFRLNLVSTDSGVTLVDNNGNVTTARNTALGYRYSGNWNRCWMEPGPNTNTTMTNILNHAVPQWDYVFIVLNTTSGGGCRRGNTAAVTMANPNGWATGSHEMGHMVGNLGDEYFGGTGNYTGGEPAAVNLTRQTSRNLIKWRQWIHPRTPVPTTCAGVTDNVGDVGLFPGATIGQNQWATGIFKPSCNGRMNSNTPQHNPVGHTQMHEMVDARHDYTFQKAYAGDFNGDGRDDLVLHNANSLALYLSSGFQLELAWIVTGDLPGWDDFRQGDRFYVGDFNGDGMDDLYVYNIADWAIPYFAMLRSTGSGFQLVRRFDQKLPGWDDMRIRDTFFVGDYDGDGRDDIAVFNYGDWSVGYFEILRSTGNNLQYVRRYDEELPGWDDMRARDTFFVGDFNHDGRDDIYVFNYGDWDFGYLEMLRSTGSGLAYVRRFDQKLPGWDDMRAHDKFFVADFDADGRDDLYVFNAEDWSMGYLLMLRSTGTNLSAVRRYDREVPGWDDLMPDDRFYVADVDGNGREDLYVFNAQDWVTEYLGILTSSGTSLSGRWQANWINGWNLGNVDQFLVANFNGGAGWDDLFVRNSNWFGMLRSYRTSVGLNTIYPRWIANHNYHSAGWW